MHSAGLIFRIKCNKHIGFRAVLKDYVKIILDKLFWRWDRVSAEYVCSVRVSRSWLCLTKMVSGSRVNGVTWSYARFCA